MGKKWKNPGRRTEYDGLYQSWNCMFKRIRNSPTYSDVTICKEWYDYDVFFEWAINNGWKPGLTLDKDILIPGNREYKPEACKWISKSDNSKERNYRIKTNPKAAIKLKGIKRNTETINKLRKNNTKKVLCIETNITYFSTAEAERELNLSNCSVRHAANPQHNQQTAGGYHWKYVQ